MKVFESGDVRKDSTVLVVDDDEICRVLLSNLLKFHHFGVVCASSGSEALQLAGSRPFDAVLLDLMMPGIDGLEVCRRLKSDKNTEHVPVILVTSMVEREARLSGIQAGADEFITKPYDNEEIALRVANAVRMKRLYDQTRQQVVRLEELERLRDNMTNMIVHDMRNPLAVVLLNMQALERYMRADASEDQKEMVRSAMQSAEYLSEMISSMLDICRVEAGLLVPNKERLALGRLVAGAIKYAGGSGHCAHVSFREPEPDIEVSADGDLIRRVVMNLLQNARKFTPSSGSIEVTIEKVADGVRVAVKDDGPGIAKENHRRIFEKFGQVEPVRQAGRRSHGLGLTFCKMAVEAHGGTIGLESDIGKGSTFYFTLPS